MLELEYKQRKGAIEVILKGKLKEGEGSNLEKQFKSEILSEPKETIGINLYLMQYIDSKGLRALIKTLHLCQENGKKLIICEATPAIENVFKFSRLENFFNLMKMDQFNSLYPLE